MRKGKSTPVQAVAEASVRLVEVVVADISGGTVDTQVRLCYARLGQDNYLNCFVVGASA